jgi:hypothetical protein
MPGGWSPAGRLGLPPTPRSRHLPLASTDGSSTRNLNKTGVRLWTEYSLDENGEMLCDLLDAFSHLEDHMLEASALWIPSTS